MAAPAKAASNNRGAVHFVRLLAKFLGYPYEWGGTNTIQPGYSTPGFDCSGLIYYTLTLMGFKNVPRTSQAQWQWVQRINYRQLQPGDLVFFVGSDGTPTAPGHVAVYLGKSTIEQAPYTGTDVQTDTFTPEPPSAQNGIVGYGRIPGLSRAKVPPGPGSKGKNLGPAGPLSPGAGPSVGGPTQPPAPKGKAVSGCLVGVPSIDLKVTSTPQLCLLSKSAGKAVKGALLAGLGVTGMVVMGALVVAGAASKTKLGREAAATAAAVPGVAAAPVRVVRAAQSRTSGLTASSARRRPSTARRAPQGATRRPRSDRLRGDADDRLYERHQRERARAAMRRTSHEGSSAPLGPVSARSRREHAARSSS